MRVQGYKLAMGAVLKAERRLCGVVVLGRPLSRGLDDGWTLEVLQLAGDGTPDVCSFLYGAAARAGKTRGYPRLVTCTLASETGTPLQVGHRRPRCMAARGRGRARRGRGPQRARARCRRSRASGGSGWNDRAGRVRWRRCGRPRPEGLRKGEGAPTEREATDLRIRRRSSDRACLALLHVWQPAVSRSGRGARRAAG
jgi:hypothetical protein